jgi:hypothetical protein
MHEGTAIIGKFSMAKLTPRYPDHTECETPRQG